MLNVSSRYTEQQASVLAWICDVFAANLRRLRHAKGLSQDDLAYEARVSRSYLSQLEKGAFYANLKIIGRISKAPHVEPAELLKLPAQRGARAR